MRLPTEHQVRELFRTLRNTNWADLENKLVDALQRNYSGTQLADGYPSSTLGPGGSNNELTSVESAASRRLYGRNDEHHEHLMHATAALDRAVSDIHTIVQELDDITALSTPNIVDAAACAICKTGGITHEWEHFGDVNGILPTAVHMCDPAYKFIYSRGRQPSYNEIRAYHERGRWSTRAS